MFGLTLGSIYVMFELDLGSILDSVQLKFGFSLSHAWFQSKIPTRISICNLTTQNHLLDYERNMYKFIFSQI